MMNRDPDFSFLPSAASRSEAYYQNCLTSLKCASSIVERDVTVRFLSRLFADYPDSFVCLTIFKCWLNFRTRRIVGREPGVTCGSYFTCLDECVCEIARPKAVSIYIYPNPIRNAARPAAHLNNRFDRVDRGQGVSAKDIEFLRWLIVDIDPVVKGSRDGVNSTANEHQACQDLLRAILDGEPAIASASLGGSSGNGAYLLVRVADLENNPDTHGMVRGFLKTLARKYRFDSAEIDPQWDATKKIGLPGSLKCKGEHSVERPRRVVEMRSFREPIETLNLSVWLSDNSVRIEPPYPVVAAKSSPPANRPRSKKSADDYAQARAWLQQRPPAISGHDGRNHTFATICVVMKGWELSESETLSLIETWNASNQPPWTRDELIEKVRVADCAADLSPRGFMRGKSSGLAALFALSSAASAAG